MPFRLVATDLSGNQVSELPGATGRSLTVAMNSLATGGFAVRLDHPDAAFLLDCEAYIKVYEDDPSLWATPQLRAHCRLITANENAQGGAGSVVCTFADPFWMLTRRLIGKSNAGYSNGTALVPVDRGAIIKDMVDTVNAEAPTGLKMGAVTAGGAGTFSYLKEVRYAEVAGQIAILSATLDGPDWQVLPQEYEAAGVVGYVGQLRVAPSLSVAQPDAVFEYGDGRLNVSGYERAVTLDGSANRVFHLPPGYPDNATLDVKTDQSAASQAVHGLLESLVNSDLSVDDLRTKLLAQHIAVRSDPRQTITFTVARDVVAGRVPRYAVDYNVGDVVPFRASARLATGWSRRINAAMRVYQVALNIDDEAGYATPALTVTPYS